MTTYFVNNEWGSSGNSGEAEVEGEVEFISTIPSRIEEDGAAFIGVIIKGDPIAAAIALAKAFKDK